MPNLNTGILEAVPFAVPSLDEQQKITGILAPLDDKIDLNYRMNNTLEAMARAIFKSWFVDFDPMLQGHPLFPHAMQNSSLGPIPERWSVGRLDDLLLLQRGFDLPTADRKPGQYPVIAASGANGQHEEFIARGPGVVTGRSGVLGLVFLILGDFWPLNTTLWIKEFRGSRPAHAYFLLSSIDFSSFDAGSAVPTLNRNHIHNLPVVIPPLAVVEEFESLALPMFEMCQNNDQQSRNLADLRDTLLPKLLSGEIRIKQAEKIVSEAV
jgi:type I restriction enzyme S subunit